MDPIEAKLFSMAEEMCPLKESQVQNKPSGERRMGDFSIADGGRSNCSPISYSTSPLQSFSLPVRPQHHQFFNPLGLPDIRGLSLGSPQMGSMPFMMGNMGQPAFNVGASGVSSLDPPGVSPPQQRSLPPSPSSSFTRLGSPPTQPMGSSLNQQMMNNIMMARNLAALNAANPFNGALLSAALAIASGNMPFPSVGVNPYRNQMMAPLPTHPIYTPGVVLKVDDVVGGSGSTVKQSGTLANSFYPEPNEMEAKHRTRTPNNGRVDRNQGSEEGKGRGAQSSSGGRGRRWDGADRRLSATPANANKQSSWKRRQFSHKAPNSGRSSQTAAGSGDAPLLTSRGKTESDDVRKWQEMTAQETPPTAQRQKHQSKVISAEKTDSTGGGMVVVRQRDDGHIDVRIVYLREFFLQCALSPHSLLPPPNFQNIVKEMEEIVEPFPRRFHSSRHFGY